MNSAPQTTKPSRRDVPASAIDRAGLERTIPRGLDQHDDDGMPAVDQRVWLDHICFARTGDAVVLARLVAEYKRYACSLARRMRRDVELGEDLDQVALESLVAALRRFDPERGVPFPAFATPTILGALRRHYRDHGWLVHVPRRVHEFAGAERIATDRLVGRLGRQPTPAELASELGMDVDVVLEAQDALHVRELRSLDATAADGRSVVDQLGTEDARYVECEDRAALSEAIDILDAPARELLRRYFFEEQTQAQIAVHLGVSQMQVSRLLAVVLRQLRNRVGPR